MGVACNNVRFIKRENTSYLRRASSLSLLRT